MLEAANSTFYNIVDKRRNADFVDDENVAIQAAMAEQEEMKRVADNVYGSAPENNDTRFYKNRRHAHTHTKLKLREGAQK